MMREIRTPVCVESKYADRQPHHVRLRRRLRMSVMARCAATPRICDSAERGDGLHDGGRAGRERERQQQIRAFVADHFVDQPLGRRGQHQPGEAADEHQHEAEAEAPAVSPDELARFAPRGRGTDLFFFAGSIEKDPTILRPLRSPV